MALAPVVARDGNNNPQSMSVMVDAVNSINIPQVGVDSTQAFYRASANFTPQATAAVTIISIQGSAAKTVRIRRILLGGVSTALSSSVFQLQRTSALGAGGTVVAPVIVLPDRGAGAAYPAATAVVQHYTATLKAAGTALGGAGPMSTWLQFTGTTVTPTVAGVGGLQNVFPEPGQIAGSSIVLRGAADFLEVQNVTPTNLGAGTVLCYVIEWVEDAS